MTRRGMLLTLAAAAGVREYQHGMWDTEEDRFVDISRSYRLALDRNARELETILGQHPELVTTMSGYLGA